MPSKQRLTNRPQVPPESALAEAKGTSADEQSSSTHGAPTTLAIEWVDSSQDQTQRERRDRIRTLERECDRLEEQLQVQKTQVAYERARCQTLIDEYEHVLDARATVESQPSEQHSSDRVRGLYQRLLRWLLSHN